MAKRSEPRVEQTDDGVRVTYPGMTLRKPGPERAVTRRQAPPVRCPYCEAEGREGRCRRSGGGSSPNSSIYVCIECCDPETCGPSRFLVFSRPA